MPMLKTHAVANYRFAGEQGAGGNPDWRAGDSGCVGLALAGV